MLNFIEILSAVRLWMDTPIYLGDGFVTSFWEVCVFGVVGGITVSMIGHIVNGFD